MENNQKIIELLQNGYVSNYAISKLSGEQMTPETTRRYRKGVDQSGPHPKYKVSDISKMQNKTKKRLLEIAKEVKRVSPTSKKHIKKLIQQLEQSGRLW